jgi:hypothetical protein
MGDNKFVMRFQDPKMIGDLGYFGRGLYGCHCCSRDNGKFSRDVPI